MRARALLRAIAVATAVAAAGGGAAARAADDALDLAAALAPDGRSDVVVFDLPAPAGAPRVRAATIVHAPPAAVTAVLLDPGRYRAVLPSLIRADVEGPAPAPAGARRIAWELEVPLFNLSGHLTLAA